MYWLLGRKSKFSTKKKLLLYKAILKPIRTYGLQLWGTASTSNIDILDQQLKKKSADTVLNTESTSVHTQMA
jgi:hypothetical protein